VSGVPIFPYERWRAALPRLKDEYRRQKPFPHMHLPGFLESSVVDAVVDEFLEADRGPWIHYKHYNENKLGMTRRQAFPALIGRVVDELNSDQFVEWLSVLTGISGLRTDPALEGGGMHQSGPGGFLNVHADFTRHHHRTDWRRRINLIVYLNRAWRSEWGGAIELWDRDMRQAVVRIPPLANHAIIFNTDEHSYHGFPDPLTCPPGTTRKSIALYYYTAENEEHFVARSTNYRARSGDGVRKSALIWADRQLVSLYSRAKSALGLSDALASRMLALIHRRRRSKR
jgi:hypothetical protein